MSGSFEHRDQDSMFFDALGKQTDAPDLTRRVMGRLGYMRAVDSAARRRRRNLWLHRAACTALMVAAALVAWQVYDNSAAVRSPADVTVPGAILHDAQQHQSRFQNLIQSIRQQVQPVQPPVVSPVESSQEDVEYQPNDDVNRSAGAPGQWV